MPQPATPLAPRDAAVAADLRQRYGFLREVVAEMEREVPYAAALLRMTDGLRLELQDGEQSAQRRDPQVGVVLTASNGYCLEEAASDRTDASAVRELARELVDRARSYRPLPGEERLELQVTDGLDGDYATPVDIDPASVPLKEKLERFEALRQRLRAGHAQAVQAICSHGNVDQLAVFANRGGLVTQQIHRALLTLILFVSDGEQRQYAYHGTGATGGLERLDVDEETLAHLADVAGALLTARPVPAGTYDVVTDEPTSGIIAHEAFGHGVETDMFVKGRARAAEYIGRQVGSELVNIVDDPTLDGAYGSYYVDDEGQLASPTRIIADGILQRGITDLFSASTLGIPRSANGRRESVQRKAYARMSNTFFAPGSSSRQELLDSLDDGLLLCDSLNGMEDPKGWGIQIWAQYAREYKGGKPTGTIYAPVSITGYVPDLLRDVSMVSDDFAMDAGTCGKGWKELVPVSSGGPYLRTRCRLG